MRKRRRTLERIARLAVMAALALPLGCVNPFTPANPEPPDSSGVPEIFDTPDLVLETMQAALQSKSTGGTNAWVHALAESTQVGDRAYRAFYDDAVKLSWQASSSQSAPEPWDLTLERKLPSQLFGIAANGTYALEWTHDTSVGNDDDPGAADTAQVHRHYLLTATLPSSTNPVVIGVGFADLSFQKKNGRWSIYRWHDRVDAAFGVNPSSTDARSMSWWRLQSLTRPQ